MCGQSDLGWTGSCRFRLDFGYPLLGGGTSASLHVYASNVHMSIENIVPAISKQNEDIKILQRNVEI